MDHVKMVSPTYEISAILLKGSYIANIQLKAMNQEGLMAQNLELGSGTLPKSGSGQLSLIFGNGVLIDFNEKGSGRGYYDTGKVPDIDLTKDSMFLITDTEHYNSDQGNAVFGGTGDNSSGSKDASDTKQAKPIQKYVVRASGVIKGGLRTIMRIMIQSSVIWIR